MDPDQGGTMYNSDSNCSRMTDCESGTIRNLPRSESVSPGPCDEQEKENKDSLGVKVKRKSRRGRSSGSLTMKGDKITSFTTERGIIYSPNGKKIVF